MNTQFQPTHLTRSSTVPFGHRDIPRIARSGGRSPFRRWAIPVGVAAAVVVGVVGAATITTDDSPMPTETARMPVAGFTTAQEMINSSIEDALAGRAPVAGFTTAQELVNASIEDALAERTAP